MARGIYLKYFGALVQINVHSTVGHCQVDAMPIVPQIIHSQVATAIMKYKHAMVIVWYLCTQVRRVKLGESPAIVEVFHNHSLLSQASS